MAAEFTSVTAPTRQSWTTRLPEGALPVATAFLASRLMVFGVILLSRLQVPPGHFAVRGGLLAVLSSGDAARYLDLAAHPSNAPHDPAHAFFPVFPLLLNIGSLLFGNIALVGILIANAALLGAGFLLHHLLRVDYPADPRISRVAVMLLMFSPASYFLTSAVPDSTALLLAIAAMLAAVRKKWWIACVCGLLLGGTVNVGYWIIVPLLVEFVRQTWQRDAAQDGPGFAQAALLALVFVPLAAAVAVGSTKHHDPWALLRVSRQPQLTLAWLQQHSRYFDGYASFYNRLRERLLLGAIALSIAGFALKVRTSYLAFALTLIAVCLLCHDLQAIRTLGLAFPLVIIMAAACARFDALYEPFLTCSMTLLALTTIVAANGFWVS